MTWWSSGVFIAAFAAPAFAASATTLAVDVEVTSCPHIDAQEAQTLIGIELSAAQVPPSPQGEVSSVRARCDATLLHIHIEDAVLGELATSLSWQPIPPKARTRRFALAVSEALIAAHRDHLAAGSELSANPAPSPAPSPAPMNEPADGEPVEQRAAIGERQPEMGLYAQLGILKLPGLWSLAPRAAIGLVWPWQRFFAAVIEADAFTSSHDLQFGQVRLLSMGLTPSLRIHRLSLDREVYLQLGATIALAPVTADSADDRFQSELHLARWWGPSASSGVNIFWGSWGLGISAHASWNVKQVDARVVSGLRTLETASYSGFSYGGGITLVHRL